MLASDLNESEIIELINEKRQHFQRGGIDSFLLVLDKY